MRYLIILLSGISLQGFSQTLDRQVIGSYGGQGNEAEGKVLLQNVGEPVTASGISGTFMLNQGFEQPDSIENGSVGYIEYEIVNEVTVYPNPGRERVNVRIRSTQKAEIYVSIYDQNGKILYEKPVMLEGTEPIMIFFDTETLAKGSYYLRFSNKDQMLLHSAQWIKN